MDDLRALVRAPLTTAFPYDPGPSVSELERGYGVSGLVKLNWNEDLFGLLPGVAKAIEEEMTRVPYYPEQAYSAFRELVGGWIGAPPEMVLPAHGIQALVLATVAVFVEPGDRVVLPTPTYGLYRQACQAAGAEIVTVPAREYRFDLDAMANAAKGAKLVFVCDPNNPTGDALTPEEWAAFLDGLPDGCLAVVDEAYGDYLEPKARPDRVSAVREGRRLVLLRTFSKLFGIAGLRLGYAVVHHDLVPCFDAVQEPFNVNRLALAAGTACLADKHMVERRRREVVRAREQFAEALRAIGVNSPPSGANFVLAATGGSDDEWYEGLLKEGFLVRRGSEFALSGHLRITIGRDDVMTAVAAAMADLAGAR